ncbi:hypothetical protein SNE35_25325 [Paucibacter sp. R3-3]|uniref:Transporter n=1 Tax=Roseateles agri TaxID=3098619 RepID=A0ABU5DP22_9BURK|nr:hypothetical protein [Paucibacter sp. R3-3]MDY0747849.1 hypothetical protein [Paucibacter sp. R3-3]
MRFFACLLASFILAGPAHAAHPLQTEDTGTQGEGNLELENGLDRARNRDGSRDFSYQPQLSWGLTPEVDLIVQPSWLAHRDPAGGPTHRAAGDTNLDAKWRFYGSAPWSLAVRAGVTLATSGQDLGQPKGTVGAHGLLALTLDAAPLTAHFNVGAAENPNDVGQRRRIASTSVALMWQASDALILTMDGSLQSNPDPFRKAWPGLLLGGVIWTVRPGLDLDVGWQKSYGPAQPARRDLLMGLTWRFAP